MRIAPFNVENLFARPKAFNTADWSIGKPALDACHEVGALIAKPVYSRIAAASTASSRIRPKMWRSPRPAATVRGLRRPERRADHGR
jgi:hypothetical protein